MSIHVKVIGWIYLVGSALWAFGILVGRGLLKRRAWAWVGGLIVSALALLLFPIGTILGVYGLVIFLQRETRPLFGHAVVSTGPAAPPARTP